MTGIDAIRKNGIPLSGTSAPQVLMRLAGLSCVAGFDAGLTGSPDAPGMVVMYTA